MVARERCGYAAAMVNYRIVGVRIFFGLRLGGYASGPSLARVRVDDRCRAGLDPQRAHPRTVRLARAQRWQGLFGAGASSAQRVPDARWRFRAARDPAHHWQHGAWQDPRGVESAVGTKLTRPSDETTACDLLRRRPEPRVRSRSRPGVHANEPIRPPRSILITTPAAMLVLALGIAGGYVAGYRNGCADAVSTVTDLPRCPGGRGAWGEDLAQFDPVERPRHRCQR